MRTAALAFLLVSQAFAAIDGTIVNRTAAAPQPGVAVTLVQPGQGGMKTLGATKSDASGKFSFDQDVSGPGPVLIQATYQSVTYTHFLPPGTPRQNVEVDVFESTKKPGTARMSQHMVLFQTTANSLDVTDSFLYENGGKATFNDPVNGSVRIYIPPAAKDNIRVTVAAPGGMPIQRPAEPAREANVYKVGYPLKPGETRFDITYSLPGVTPMKFSSKRLDTSGPTRLVAPTGIAITGDGVTSLGQEPSTKATVYDVTATEYTVDIQGQGSLAQDAAAASPDEDPGMPQIQEAPPPIYAQKYWILGFAFVILALGAFLLYRAPQRDGALSGK